MVYNIDKVLSALRALEEAEYIFFRAWLSMSFTVSPKVLRVLKLRLKTASIVFHDRILNER